MGVYQDDFFLVAKAYICGGFAFDLVTSVPSAIIEYVTLQDVKDSCVDGLPTVPSVDL